MFTFLTDYRSDDWHNAIVIVHSQSQLYILQSAEDDICEGGGQCQGAVQISSGELVFAGLDRIEVIRGKDGVCVVCVKLFLCLNCHQSIDDSLTKILVLKAEAWHVIGDIEEQIGEEGNLEYLVERDQLNACQVVSLKCRGTSVRFGAVF